MLPAQRRRCFAALADLGVPRIHFGVGTGELLALMRAAGADVVGVDWRVAARRRPRAGSATTSRCRATSTRPSAWRRGRSWPTGCATCWPQRGHPGHIFNLGHGVLPETDPAMLEQVVDLVHARRAAADGRGRTP